MFAARAAHAPNDDIDTSILIEACLPRITLACTLDQSVREVHDETGNHSRRADVVLARQTERAGLAGDARRGHGVRFGPAAVRPRDRRALRRPDRASDRTRP